MRTPGIIIFGLVLAPCGWVLDLTSTVAPNWRTLQGVSGQSSDIVINQGIWDICMTSTMTTQNQCNLKSSDTVYFQNQIIPIAQGLMVVSLIVTAIGLVVVTPGARCWTLQPPRWIVVGIGGVIIFCSGVLTIIPIAWYTHVLTNLTTTTTFVNAASKDIRVGYCIVLGYIGGIMEVLGGFALFLGFFKRFGGQNRAERRPEQEIRPDNTGSLRYLPTQFPRYDSKNAPNSSNTSTSSNSISGPYHGQRYNPRSNGGKKGEVNRSYDSNPFDADL